MYDYHVNILYRVYDYHVNILNSVLLYEYHIYILYSVLLYDYHVNILYRVLLYDYYVNILPFFSGHLIIEAFLAMSSHPKSWSTEKMGSGLSSMYTST